MEALAGFGTPVAVTAVMLIALGFQPIKAAALALVANTAPVAFGAMATPIITLSEVTALDKGDLGSMVGRQTPFLALIVPLILIGMVDGRRGIRQAWPVAVVGGIAFALGQFLCSNFLSVELTDIVAALVSTGAIVAFLRFWQPGEPLLAEEAPATGRFQRPAAAGASVHDPVMEAQIARRDDAERDSTADVVKAYAPYAIIIAIFSISQIPAVKDWLAESPWTTTFQWPGLDVQSPDGEPLSSLTFNFSWLPAAGTLMLISGLITMAVIGLSPGRAVRVMGATLDQLKWAIVTVAAVLALAYVMNQAGLTITLGLWAAGAGCVLRVPVGADRLAWRGGDGFGHLVERPVRRAPGDRGEGRRDLADAARRGEQLRRRPGQDDLAAEPRDRGRSRWLGRQGGRHVP
jgi:lactate permease